MEVGRAVGEAPEALGAGGGVEPELDVREGVVEACGGRRADDYKFTEAALENFREVAPGAWRDRILSASMAYFIGSATTPSPVSRKALQLLG